MQRFTFDIFARDFTAPDPILPGLEWTVERYSTKSYGGPYEAIVSAKGDLMTLWELLTVLRCPVNIRAQQGDIVWWGYISSVDITTINPFAENSLPIQVSSSLESMSNRIAVAWNEQEAGGNLGERQTTAWIDDTWSQGLYGVKELLASGGDLTTEDLVLNAQQTLLNQKRLPITEITFRQNLPSRATVRCFGWWQSMAWKYANIATENVVDTAVQLQNLCTTYGQFFRSVDCNFTSGVDANEFQDGDTTALKVAEALMTAGTTNYRRMLVYVDIDRRLRIFEEPLTSAPYFQHSDGNLYDAYGVPLRPELCPSGNWVRLLDIIPPNINLETVANPDFRFIESSEYDAKTELLSCQYRDAPDPFDIGINTDG